MTPPTSAGPVSRNGPVPDGIRTAHTVMLSSPAPILRRLLGEVERWPLVFGAVVYAATAEGPRPGADLWLHADGRVARWSGELRTRPDGSRLETRISRRPAASGTPNAAVRVSWTLEAVGPASTRVTLSQEADPAEDEADFPFGESGLVSLLADLAVFADLGDALDEWVFAFEDTVCAQGAAADALRFLARAQDWPGAISHVASVRLDEPEPGVQFAVTGVRAPGGGVQKVPSVRVSLPDRVAYTPLTVPPFASAHLGEWIVAQRAEDTVAITGRHTVALRPDRIAAAFGPRTTAADARSRVRAALGAHSLATLEAARRHTETTRATQPGG